MATNCEKCGNYIDVSTRMVMITDNLWLSIANKKDILCDECIEDKLGRKISISDLKRKPNGDHIPCNIAYFGSTSRKRN